MPLRFRRAVEPVSRSMTADGRDRHHRPLDHASPLGAGRTRTVAEKHDLGFYHALVEARLPFELLSDQVMTKENLDRFKVIILANASCLSDAQNEAIRDYVARGGSVVASYETSLRDEFGKKRARIRPGPTCSAPNSSPARAASSRTPMWRSTATIRSTQGFEGAERIMGGTQPDRMSSRPAMRRAPFLYVPDFPDLPMEEVYPRKDAEKAPRVIAREHRQAAAARSIFPGISARSSGRSSPSTTASLIANAVHWALGKTLARRRRTAAASSTWRCARTPEGIALSLFNLTNPMMMKGPDTQKTYPLAAQTGFGGNSPGQVGGEGMARGSDRARKLQRRGWPGTGGGAGIERLEVLHLTWK